MNGLQQFGLHKPPHPTPIGGGSSNRLAYRELLAQTGEPFGSLLEPPKNGGTNDEAAKSLRRNLRLSSQQLLGTPIPITPVFDVTAAV
jgi:hypothetical protein